MSREEECTLSPNVTSGLLPSFRHHQLQIANISTNNAKIVAGVTLSLKSKCFVGMGYLFCFSIKFETMPSRGQKKMKKQKEKKKERKKSLAPFSFSSAIVSSSLAIALFLCGHSLRFEDDSLMCKLIIRLLKRNNNKKTTILEESHTTTTGTGRPAATWTDQQMNATKRCARWTRRVGAICLGEEEGTHRNVSRQESKYIKRP